MSDVKISVDARLDKIEAALGDLNKLISDIGKNIQGQGKQIEKTYQEGFGKSAKQAENFMARLSGLGRKTLKNLGDDFKALFSLNAIKESLKLSDKFRDRAVQVMTLNDAIRKMGASFGIAQSQFGKFQQDLQKRLGDVGVSSEAAANALEGLMGTQVKGEKNLIDFAKQAGMVAALSGEGGSEGQIAKGMAEVALRGFTPEQIGTAVSRIQMGSGLKATESLSLMKDVMSSMTPEQVTQMGGLKGVEDLAIIMKTSGKESADFLKRLVQGDENTRAVFESLGAKNVFNEKGFDPNAFKGFVDNMRRMHKDPKIALKIAGMSDENTVAFLKLYDSLDQVKNQADMVNKSFVTTEEALKNNRGFAESFGAAVNKVFGNIPLSRITQPLTNLASDMAESDVGSAAMVGGSAVLAAMLAGGGLRGVGSALGLGGGMGGVLGGVAKGKALETAGVQSVYVVNASEIGGGGVGGLAGAGLGGMLGKAGLVGAAGVAGYAVGQMIEPYVASALDKYTLAPSSEGIGDMNVVERAMLKFSRMTGLGLDEQTLSNLNRSEAMTKSGQVKVVIADPRLKEVHSPTRGGSFE
jgi:hypothetical protein